jgi:hypothetical protein
MAFRRLESLRHLFRKTLPKSGYGGFWAAFGIVIAGPGM